MKLGTFAALGLALAAGCADNNTSVQWYALCYPPADVACPFAETCDTEFVGRVAINPTATSSALVLFAEMHNQRPNNADPTIGRLNTNDAYVRELVVTYSAPIALPGHTTAIQATIPAAGSKIVPVVLTTAFTTLGDGTTAVAHVVARGKYADESTFETAAFDVPVLKCATCIPAQTCPSGSTAAGYCPSTGANQVPAALVCESTTPAP
jgi:hypothetical protein